MNKITPSCFQTSSKKTIKKLFRLFVLSMVGQMSWAQVSVPHYDGLNYPATQSLVTQSGWALSSGATNDLLITSGSLSYPSLQASTGNKLSFSGGGEDAAKAFTFPGTKMYCSYILNITDVSTFTSGGYFAALTTAANTATPGTGSQAATVWAKIATGGYNLGFSARANQTTVGTGPTNLQYSSTVFPVGTPVFIVISYEKVVGTTNDICNVWINPTPGTSEPAFTFTTTTTSDLADVSAFFIRQNGSTATPTMEMDEIRFGAAWEEVTPAAPVAAVTPTLTADVTSNTVDNDIDITFTDNAAWRALVTDVKIGSTNLISGIDYDLTAGNLKLKPSGLNTLLTISGSKAVSVVATGYADALITQEINAGTPTANSTVSIGAALAPNATGTITATAKDQYNNLVSGYGFKYDVAIINNGLAITESYIIDGTAHTASANNISVVATTDASGVATFTAILPAVIDGSDGISIQTQLSDGTTNIGTAFEFFQLASQTISFGALAPVTYGDAVFNLTATSSSLLPVSYSSSNSLVATVDTNGAVTIIGVGTTTITASQTGNNAFSPALNVTQDLVVNCAASSATITGTTVICSGESANLQVAISASLTQQYTVIYSDGTNNYTISNYSSGTLIPITPTASTTYSLVSVIGSNPNICTAANSNSTIVTVNTTAAPTATAQTFCNSATVANLTATGSDLKWYAGETGGSALASTEALSSTTYYVSQTVNSCEGPRTSVVVTVTTTAAPTATAQTFCNSATVANLTATGFGLKWYAGETGGSALASTEALSSTTYYVSQTVNSCEGPRTSVVVTVNTTAAPTATAQTFCNSATVANLTATGSGLKWYADETGGSALASTEALSTTTYYVSQTVNSCEGPRTSVVVTVNTTAAPTGSASQVFNTNNPVLISDLVVNGTSIAWYSSLANALSETNPLASNFEVVTGITYYAMQTVNGCLSSAPLEVTVTVNLATVSFDLMGLQYYPNPMIDVLNISYSEVITKIQIFNSLGQVVFVSQPNSINPTISVSELPASNYFVEVESNGNKKVLKLLKR